MIVPTGYSNHSLPKGFIVLSYYNIFLPRMHSFPSPSTSIIGGILNVLVLVSRMSSFPFAEYICSHLECTHSLLRIYLFPSQMSLSLSHECSHSLPRMYLFPSQECTHSLLKIVVSTFQQHECFAV